MFTELVMLSNHLIFCHLLLLLQFSPESGSFPMSQLFESSGQSIGASASASVLPMKIQGWFPWGLTDLISLLSKGHSRVFSSTTVQKHHFFGIQPFLLSSSHIHTLEKSQLWLDRSLLAKWRLCLLMWLSRLVITFLPRGKCLNFMAAVTICSDFGAPKNKVCHCFHCFSIYLPWSDGTRCHDLRFLNVEL